MKLKLIRLTKKQMDQHRIAHQQVEMGLRCLICGEPIDAEPIDTQRICEKCKREWLGNLDMPLAERKVIMNENELQEILENHILWLNERGGERANLRNADLRNADLQYADLQYADLRNADLRNADLRNADLQYANLYSADLCGADLRNADLQYANLYSADLRNADLRNADLDFSCLPLWCGSKGVIVDRRIAQQIAAHFCALKCDDADYIKARDAILGFAQGSHVAKFLLESEE